MSRANLPAKKYRKGTPTITKLNFELSGAEHYISISSALSAINRRMYRQGLYYYVNSVEVHNAEAAIVDLYTAPDTWVTRAAWKRGFEIFRKMQAKALETTEMSVGPYNDYRVALDHSQASHYYNTSMQLGSINDAGNPTPTYTEAFRAPATYAGENPQIVREHNDVRNQQISEFVSSMDTGSNVEATTPVQFFSHLVGVDLQGAISNMGGGLTMGGISSVGLINSYQNTRNTISPQETVDVNFEEDLLLNLFATGDEDEIADILEEIDETDKPPYDLDLYVGSTNDGLHHVARIANDDTDLGRVAQGNGFCAPCGLIKVQTTADTGFRLVLNLAVGTYHGVYAERMI
jgi:hypothetical protein